MKTSEEPQDIIPNEYTEFRDLFDKARSETISEHINQVKQVLLRLRQHHLYAKLEKCNFHQKSTTFLGYVISDSGFSMDPYKLEAGVDWSLLSSLKGIQRFLGFANYYRKFIHKFFSIVAPIMALTKKGAVVSWPPAAIQSFNALKKAFISAPILIHPNPKLPFTLEVDA
ncbi:uncharacterized protein LOC142494734 [Ascaphus truei]|uniref:uncharacterized protein LOC142494734 n=1 Tax=Ascaphus truei TaxID=8439 RepID=UPI003F591507